jgi:hypothetical protein
MTHVSFDTLGTLDQLKAAGFSDGQARAVTQGLQAASPARQGELATEADIVQLRAGLEGKMSALETRPLKALNDQQRWTIGFMSVALTLLFAAIKLL